MKIPDRIALVIPIGGLHGVVNRLKTTPKQMFHFTSLCEKNTSESPNDITAFLAEVSSWLQNSVLGSKFQK